MSNNHSINRFVEFCFLAVILPLLYGFISYYGYRSNYSELIYSDDLHEELFEKEVYKYRVAGKFLYDELYNFIKNNELTPHSYYIAKIKKPEQELRNEDKRYFAYYLFNNVFLLFFSISLYSVMKSRFMGLSGKELFFAHGLIVLLLCLSMFVVTFYDLPLYFLMALAYFYMLRDKSSDYIKIALLVVAGLAFRESSALIISSYTALLLTRKSKTFFKHFHKVALPLILYTVGYVALRLFFEDGDTRILSGQDNSIIAWGVALSFFVGLGYFGLVFAGTKARKTIFLFLILSSPYFLLVFLGVVLFEIRLFFPLIFFIIMFLITPEKSYISVG